METLSVNDWIGCPHCDDVHRVYEDIYLCTQKPPVLSYKCDGKIYIAYYSGHNYVKKHVDRNLDGK